MTSERASEEATPADPALNGHVAPADEATTGDALAEMAGSLLAGISPAVVVKAIPDVVKVSTAMLWRTNRWTFNTSLHLGAIVLNGAIAGRPAQTLIDEVGSEARRALRELLGVADAPDPMPKALRARITSNGSADPNPAITLPDRLDALLDASADMSFHDAGGHPAYVRLLSELAPDEARILRLFAQHGAQAAVDVRTRRPFGVGSTLVAPGITMIGRYAGCRHVDRVPAYLNNLFRLGLVWFSREALPEQSVYDVLEAQEEVEAAMKLAGRGVTVRRSIELTAFGRNLCAMTGLLSPTEGTARASQDEAPPQLRPLDAR